MQILQESLVQLKPKFRIDEYHPIFDRDDARAVSNVVQSQWVSEGKLTCAFERKLASIMGYKYGVVTVNGTMAISLALMAAGIGENDSLTMPDLTFAGTANAVKAVGAEPTLIDIDENDFCARSVDVPVALNGRSVDGGIVIDAAQALGSSIGKAKQATLSFAPNKIITTGQGGMVFTDSKALVENVRRLKDHGRLDKADFHQQFGFNAKFTDLQAALGLSQLDKLPKRIRQKQTIFKHYRDELESLCPPFQDGELLWNQDILVNNRDRLAARLLKLGIQTRPFYAPLHTQPAYKTNWRFPVTERISATGLWLPSSPDLSSEEVSFICDSIKRSLK